MASQYFLPLVEAIALETNNTLMIGINGCQGSGKSTLAALLERILTERYDKRVANLSIDDFYLTKAERAKLGEKIHPLLTTRGVPGTHDIALLENTLKQLTTSGQHTICRFDKATDDRATENQLTRIDTPVDIIILEGWCVGVTPQDQIALSEPINQLEKTEDANGQWRSFVNASIEHYQQVFKQIEQLIMLKAPSFECVKEWRAQQEKQLSLKTKQYSPMSCEELEHFIAHYQRLTEHMLRETPKIANHVFHLNSQHKIIRHDRK